MDDDFIFVRKKKTDIVSADVIKDNCALNMLIDVVNTNEISRRTENRMYCDVLTFFLQNKFFHDLLDPN